MHTVVTKKLSNFRRLTSLQQKLLLDASVTLATVPQGVSLTMNGKHCIFVALSDFVWLRPKGFGKHSIWCSSLADSKTAELCSHNALQCVQFKVIQNDLSQPMATYPYSIDKAPKTYRQAR